MILGPRDWPLGDRLRWGALVALLAVSDVAEDVRDRLRRVREH